MDELRSDIDILEQRIASPPDISVMRKISQSSLSERSSLVSASGYKDKTYGLTDSKSSRLNLVSPEDNYKRSASVVNIEPLQPITLTWENLTVSVPSKKPRCCRKSRGESRTQILKNVTGIVRPGQLVALMGASGAGKTTLLNALTGRNKGSGQLAIEGVVKVNGEQIGEDISSVSAYIQQDDLFIGTLTVREHLIFQALLRMSSRYTYSQKIARADQVLYELGLTNCQHTKIGITGLIKGISGGEAKRLAFASEVLTNPSLMFCDEPTTGLDSYMAINVVEVLQKLASKDKTVLCTIHQPSSEVYAMFDRVMLLAEGRVAYFGPTPGALSLFERCGFPCPTDFNPADFFVQTLAIQPGKREESLKIVDTVTRAYDASDEREELERDVHHHNSLGSSFHVTINEEIKLSRYKSNWFVQVWVLTWRCLLNYYRNRTVAGSKLFTKLVMGIFVGLVYLDNKLDQTGIMNINGALFFVLMEVTFPVVFSVLYLIPPEYPLLCREHHDGMYRVSSYYVSKILSFLPVFSLDGVLFLLISYYMVGLNGAAANFFTTILIVILVEQSSTAFGFMVSTMSPSFPVAIVIAAPIVTLFQMMGGLYANVASIPVYLSWIQYISWFRYGYESLTVNQWHSIDNISCYADPNLPCFSTGDQVLEYQLSFNPTALDFDLGLLVVLIVAFHIIGFLALLIRANKGR